MPIYALGIRRKTVPTVLIAHARLRLVGVINQPWLQDKIFIKKEEKGKTKIGFFE